MKWIIDSKILNRVTQRCIVASVIGFRSNPASDRDDTAIPRWHIHKNQRYTRKILTLIQSRRRPMFRFAARSGGYFWIPWLIMREPDGKAIFRFVQPRQSAIPGFVRGVRKAKARGYTAPCAISSRSPPGCGQARICRPVHSETHRMRWSHHDSGHPRPLSHTERQRASFSPSVDNTPHACPHRAFPPGFKGPPTNGDLEHWLCDEPPRPFHSVGCTNADAAHPTRRRY